MFIILVVLVLIILRVTYKITTTNQGVANFGNDQNQQKAVPNEVNQANPASAENVAAAQKTNLAKPTSRVGERVTKKPFGIYITPQNSPVQPERFAGYHTGTDFETFSDEQGTDVPVYAIISGKIVLEKWASGYGGVLVESGEINGSPATIVYGHLNLASISKTPGDSFDTGEKIGNLGEGLSHQTDGERKHLHLGIHKGNGVNILGYVQNKNDLNQWIDPVTVLP
jgi:murein DD-endopeptidase MepM/ murein hydrolase activator NlpD